MRKIEYADSFDAAYIWGGSFGYYSDAENKEIIKRIVRAVKVGGYILLDQPNREFILRNFRTKSETGSHRITTSWNEKTSRIKSIWETVREDTKRTSFSEIRLYTPAELKRMFEGCGCRITKVYGSKRADAYRRGSKRLIIVCRVLPK